MFTLGTDHKYISIFLSTFEAENEYLIGLIRIADNVLTLNFSRETWQTFNHNFLFFSHFIFRSIFFSFFFRYIWFDIIFISVTNSFKPDRWTAARQKPIYLFLMMRRRFMIYMFIHLHVLKVSINWCSQFGGFTRFFFVFSVRLIRRSLANTQDPALVLNKTKKNVFRTQSIETFLSFLNYDSTATEWIDRGEWRRGGHHKLSKW